MSGDRQRYLVYVDEAGDRGWRKESSPVFVLTAVVVRDQDDHLIREMLDQVNISLGRSPMTVLHWAENVRYHSARKFVARMVGSLPVVLISVVLCKDSFRVGSSAFACSDLQYLYTLRRLLERVSWFVDRQCGIADIRLAHVRRFKYDVLERYLAALRETSACAIMWDALKNGTRPKVQQPGELRGLQVADVVAGCLYSAVRADEFGDTEAAYLLAISERLWRGSNGRLDVYGINPVRGGNHSCVAHWNWWAAVNK